MRPGAGHKAQMAGRIGAVSGALVILLVLAFPGLAQTPAPADTITPTPTDTSIPGDAYEPDGQNPPWLAEGEAQDRTFDPEGDVDRAKFYVKAGHWYQVQTYDLGPLVDTVLTVEVGEVVYEDDDGGPEPLASLVRFQASADGEAIITIANRQAVYGPAQRYQLYAGEVAAPTVTPTAAARPTRHPRPTATPPRPVVNFAATPEQVARPGECATLHWAVDRASEVFLVLPNGNQEGVEGRGERRVCPTETSEYLLKVNAPGGDETVRVQVSVPLPTPTATPRPKRAGGSKPVPRGKATLHVVVFVDNNGNGACDPDEGVSGAPVYLRSQANPERLAVQATDLYGQTHFEKTATGSYALLIPHLGRAEALSFRGEELTVGILVPALRLPSRIP